VNRFALPELIVDGVTGVLLDSPVDQDELCRAISKFIDDRRSYLDIRKAARDFAMRDFQWDRIGSKVAERIFEALGKHGQQ
jgi:glycosyltransferase involved in cell wall biosynthesis